VDKRPENSQRAEDWVGVRFEAAIFVVKNEPVWMTLGVVMGAALGC
jgi:hypothetical protein